MEERMVVCFFTLKSFNPGDIHVELILVYGADVPVLRTLYKWHKRFAQGRTKLFYNLRSE
jgi:hypothetical protein